jgi:hypothetical protein
VSLQSLPESAVTTALMVDAWWVVSSCIRPNPGQWRGKGRRLREAASRLRLTEAVSVIRAEPICVLTGHGAVTTASCDAGAQVRIIYVNACVMALGAASGVRRARVGLRTSRGWCSVFAHCVFTLVQVVHLLYLAIL